MTKVTMEHIGRRYYISALGHSGYAESGKDIVCAGVSALAQAFSFYCEDMSEKKKCTLEEFEVHDGMLLCVVEGSNDVLEPAYQMLKIGIEAMVEAYPKYVALSGEKSK